MAGFKFVVVVASILVAGFDAAMASPAVRYGTNHWGGYGSLVRMALRNMNSVGVDAEYYTSVSSPTALGSSAPFGEAGRVMVVDSTGALPFYVLENQFFQVQNSTSVLYVNVVNTTDASASTLQKAPVGSVDPPYVPSQRSYSIHTRKPSFQLLLDTKPAGIAGKWMYDEAKQALAFQATGADKLRGQFYSCQDRGVYVALE